MSLVEFVNVLLVKHRRVFVTVLVLTFGAAAAVTFSLPKEYESTATLFVGENRPVATGANSVPLDEVLSQTYRELLGTPAIAREVAPRVHMPAGELSGKMSFTIATGTHLINVTATDRAAARAAALANVYASTFVRDRQNSAATRDSARLSALRSQMQALALEIASLRSSNRPADIAHYLAAQDQLSVDRDTVSTIAQNDTLQGTNVAVASPAFAPSSPARPKPKLYLLLGAVLAFLAAVGAALISNAFDTRLHEGSEVAERLGLPVMGALPVAKTFNPASDPALHEAIEFMRTNLNLISDPSDPLRTIAVCGALPAEGKTAVLAEFARSLARSGASVIAVDADLRRPTLAARFGIDGSAGLTSIVAGSNGLRELLVADPKSGVRILPAGPIPPDATIYFNSDRLSNLLRELRAEADYVLFDTAPLLVAPETTALAAEVDGVVVVVDISQAKSQNLTAARDQLAKASARTLGVVLNRCPRRHDAYRYAGYYGEPTTNGKVTRASASKVLRGVGQSLAK